MGDGLFDPGERPDRGLLGAKFSKSVAGYSGRSENHPGKLLYINRLQHRATDRKTLNNIGLRDLDIGLVTRGRGASAAT